MSTFTLYTGIRDIIQLLLVRFLIICNLNSVSPYNIMQARIMDDRNKYATSNVISSLNKQVPANLSYLLKAVADISGHSDCLDLPNAFRTRMYN